MAENDGMNADHTPVQDGATEEQIEAAARAMFDHPGELGNYTWAEMVVQDPSRADIWREDARRIVDAALSVSASADPADEHHDAEERQAEGERGAAFFRAASAERRSHEGRGWTREHDSKHGPEHPLRLALDYLANGKPVKAGSLIFAALDLLAESEDHAATVTGDREKRVHEVLDKYSVEFHHPEYGVGLFTTCAGEIAGALAAPVEVDREKLAEVISDQIRALWETWENRTQQAEDIADAVAEWLRGDGR